jgi:hypothetical protein
MPVPVCSAPPTHWVRGLVRLVDWRLVAAIGLPLWAFIIGVVVTRKPAPPTPPPIESVGATAELPAPPPAPAEPIPAPREVVVRTEFQPLPVVVPVPAPESVAAASDVPEEFKLPASEVLPGDRCKTFDTKIRFHAGLPEAAQEAKLSKKMLLVLHISGNFDDPGFT